ncbi:MAG TPA: phosphocholine cytidylyltransferase family protein [Polyangiaceae bacterium]|jgi:choline kinase|nr:phosphocholine cytidylyltransferase family protein [Polyangiaceae bacterium]
MKTTAAVILVAGIGSRLRPITDDRPKALVDLGGETILGRAVRLLAEYGVRKLVLATGYREDAVKAAMQGAPLTVEYCKNPEFDSTQNSVSLALCRGRVGSDAFFKLDGDVVFQRQVLERLDAPSAELAVAVDAGRTLDAEAMKVTVEAGRITAFGKSIALSASAGESIGIERLSGFASAKVFDALERTIAGGEKGLYYEDVYSRLIAQGVLDAELVGVHDLPWTEVDDFADLARARELVGRAV